MSAVRKIALASSLGLTAPLIVGGVRHVRIPFPFFSIVMLASVETSPPAHVGFPGPFHIESKLMWVTGRQWQLSVT